MRSKAVQTITQSFIAFHYVSEERQTSFMLFKLHFQRCSLIRPVQSTAFKFCRTLFLFYFFFLQCSNHALLQDVQRFIASVHQPPMNKFVYKLHGYIVYLMLHFRLVIKNVKKLAGKVKKESFSNQFFNIQQSRPTYMICPLRLITI